MAGFRDLGGLGGKGDPRAPNIMASCVFFDAEKFWLEPDMVLLEFDVAVIDPSLRLAWAAFSRAFMLLLVGFLDFCSSFMLAKSRDKEHSLR